MRKKIKWANEQVFTNEPKREKSNIIAKAQIKEIWKNRDNKTHREQITMIEPPSLKKKWEINLMHLNTK